jgi:transposase
MVKAYTQVPRFELCSEQVGPLPIVNHFLGRIGLDAALSAHVPGDDRRLRLDPAAALGVVVRNLCVDHEPVYALSEWASGYEPCLLGLRPGELALLNDDRLGRCLDRLFDADRSTMLTEVVLKAVRAFGIDCTELHNDSTSVTFSGAYRSAGGQARGAKSTARITFGFNKDHRPDLRQLVWILTVSADGAIPIAHRVVDGNTTDDQTHVASWDELRRLVGRNDFLYVADSKLCTRSAMEHIDGNGGRFVTVLPRSRREDGWFRDWATRNTPAFTEAVVVPPHRRGGEPDVLSTFESPLGSSEGYRIIWVHSTGKKARDATARAARIERSERELSQLATRLSGPKCRTKTRVAALEAAKALLEANGTTEFFELSVNEERDKTYTASHGGSPSPKTTFRQSRSTRFRLTWKLRPHVVKRVAASDGCWPLITNDKDLSPKEILAAYRYQPHLERRHHCLKGAQSVAPVRLHSPARIEALLCCHFVALLVHALVERQIRTAMAAAPTRTIALYPEERECAAPSAARIFDVFAGLTRHRLYEGGRLVETFEPRLDSRQRTVLGLLGIPVGAYEASK